MTLKLKRQVTEEVEINLPYYCQSDNFVFAAKIISDTEYISIINTSTHTGYNHDFGEVVVAHFYENYTQCTEQEFKNAFDKLPTRFKYSVLLNEDRTEEIPMFTGTMDELNNLNK